MPITDILNQTAHRPWPLPAGKWNYYQEWNNAIFMHWRVNEAEPRKHIHPGIEIDTIDGQAWISVVAFDMHRVRPRNLPVFPPLSNFHEVNVRTYTKKNDRAGVYFFSLEGGKKMASTIAGKVSRLPYRYSDVKRGDGLFESHNQVANDRLRIEFRLGSSVTQKSVLDKWLTERYALIQNTDDVLNYFDIHHPEWPMREIELTRLEISYPAYNELLQGQPDLVHYSPGVAVVAWKGVRSPLTAPV